MSPLKKLIRSITGRNGPSADEVILRAFGKLPSSREFLHLEAWQEPARLFQQWLQEGHQRWVTRVSSRDRGMVASCRLFARLPQSEDSAVTACVWNSRDSAAPARAFPMALFVTPRPLPPGEWVHQLLSCHFSWMQLTEQFDPLFQGRLTLQDLRRRQVETTEDLDGMLSELRNEAVAIPCGPWLGALAAAAQCPSERHYLAYLSSRTRQWQRRDSDRLAVRLPLSRSLSYHVQAAMWLSWLQRQVVEPSPLTALVVPQNVPDAPPALAVLCRPLGPDDFQLLTTNAHTYDALDDLTRIASAAEIDPGDPPVALLKALEGTLWDWGGLEQT